MNNYEREIDCFYAWITSNALGASCIALWHALSYTWRSLGYPSTFTLSIKVLCVRTGLSEKTVQRARNTLQQKGLIKWDERGGSRSAKYTFISFVGHNDAQTVPQTVAQTVPQTVAINNNNNLLKDIDNVVVNNNNVGHNDAQSDAQTVAQIDPQGIKIIQKHYEQRVKCLLSSTACMHIIEFLEAGVEPAFICRAIDISINHGANNWAYAKVVIDNSIASGVLTCEAYEQKEANRAASKNRMKHNESMQSKGDEKWRERLRESEL